MDRQQWLTRVRREGRAPEQAAWSQCVVIGPLQATNLSFAPREPMANHRISSMGILARPSRRLKYSWRLTNSCALGTPVRTLALPKQAKFSTSIASFLHNIRACRQRFHAFCWAQHHADPCQIVANSRWTWWPLLAANRTWSMRVAADRESALSDPIGRFSRKRSCDWFVLCHLEMC